MYVHERYIILYIFLNADDAVALCITALRLRDR